MGSGSHTNICLLLDKGQYTDAYTGISKLCEENSANAETWYLKGYTCLLLHKYHEAEVSLKRSLELDPEHAGTYYELACVLNAQGNTNGSISALQSTIRYDPHHTDAYVILSKIYYAGGNTSKAVETLQQAFKKTPSNHYLLIIIGNLYRDDRSFHIAKKYYKDALTLEPDSYDILVELAFAYENDKSDPTQIYANLKLAKQYYNKALEKDPGADKALSGLANLYIKQRDPIKAYNTIQPYLNRTKEASKILEIYLKVCSNTKQCEDAIEKATKYVNDASNPNNISKDLLFALANKLDEQRKYDEAFQFYKKANLLVKDSVNPDIVNNSINDTINTFTLSRISSLQTFGSNSDMPVFIIGMPRSGTTLVEQIMSMHPLIYAGGEMRDISEISEDINNKTQSRYPECLFSLDGGILSNYAESYIQKIINFSDSAVRVTNKLPTNFVHLGLIAILFPKAIIIHCTRNPIDTCLSCYFQKFSIGGLYDKNIPSIITAYKQYLKLMDYWKNSVNIEMHEIKYESLVHNPENIVRELLDYCGLEWDERCLAFNENRRVVLTASASQVREKLYSRSIERWRNYKDHIGLLLDAFPDYVTNNK